MKTLAQWCFRHRKMVVAGWLVLLVVLIGASSAAGGAKYADAFSLPGTDSTKATALLQSSAPSVSGDAESVVFKVGSGSIRDAAVQQRISAMLTKVATLPHVAGVRSPYGPAGASQVSADGTIAYAVVNFDAAANKLPVDAVNTFLDATDAARTSGLQVEVEGQAIEQAKQKPGGVSELIGVAAAAIVLFLAFGSLLSMLLPLLTAIAGIGTGITLVGLLSHSFGIASFAPTLSALVGLGVGIDYALFIVTRYRNTLKAGRTPEESIVMAMNTSGRAVLFAGGTVCIALLGMLVLGISFLDGVAIAASITVILCVLAAVTLLPALMGLMGSRLLSKKERRNLADAPVDVHAGSRWSQWATTVQGRPRVLAGIAVLIMVVLSIPTLSLRLGSSDASSDPASSTTRKAYDLLAEGFGPGFNGPLLVVAEPGGPGAPPVGAALQVGTVLQDKLSATSGVARVIQLPLKTGNTTVFQVYPSTSPQSKETSDLITRLRSDVLPGVESSTHTQIYVGGATAVFADFAHVLSGKLVLFILVIVALGALLLMLAFRSIVIPLTGAVMNLLAAAASFGVVVAIFQWGWGSEALGLGHSGPVEAFLPVLMIASCSACPWTTRCSWSAGCTRNGATPVTTTAPCESVRPRPARW